MKPIYVERTEWDGEVFINELYETSVIPDVSPVTQVQAVCFTEDGEIVLYKHIDGWFGLPGGKVEPNEDFFEALKREIYEETACQLLNAEIIAFVKSWKEKSPEKVSYNLRYMAKVNALDVEVQDPAGKAIERVIVPMDKASSILNWGEKGEILINLASCLI